jgi:hypothetical protein
MQWVPKVLKRSIVKETIRSSVLKPESPQKRQFLFREIVTKYGILQEIAKPRLIPASTVIFFLNKSEFFRFARGEPFI